MRESYCSLGTLLYLLHACGAAPGPETEPACPGVERLSHRELEVARKVAEGLTNQQVARLLHISEPTVKFHLKQVFRKLGITCRSRLAFVLSALPPSPEGALPRDGAYVAPLQCGINGRSFEPHAGAGSPRVREAWVSQAR
jgi:DNA-binding CsgD family transcriptional regulator